MCMQDKINKKERKTRSITIELSTYNALRKKAGPIKMHKLIQGAMNKILDISHGKRIGIRIDDTGRTVLEIF